MLVQVKDGKWLTPNIPVENGKPVCSEQDWRDFIVPTSMCAICGNLLWSCDFILWRAHTTIAICCFCGEHTLAGLNRDWVELGGNEDARRKPSLPTYDVRFLRRQVGNLAVELRKVREQLVEAQNQIAKQNER